MSEAQRQQRLLAALADGAVPDAALRESGARAARGLEAYRANAEGIAERALASRCPTLQALLGADDFAHLAREFRCAHPPERGDLGEWGEALPAWLAGQARLAAWPWLGDCARLDAAIHDCERAADAVPDPGSLQRLGIDDPARLTIVLMPGTALVRSAWPIVAIHHAHQLRGDAAEPAFARVREAIAAEQRETALVVRLGWRADVVGLEAADADWVEALLAGASLELALQRAGAGFDFAAWLGRAIQAAWVKGVVASVD